MNKALLSLLEENENDTSNCLREKYIRNCDPKTYVLGISSQKSSVIQVYPIMGKARAMNRIDNNETTSCCRDVLHFSRQIIMLACKYFWCLAGLVRKVKSKMSRVLK